MLFLQACPRNMLILQRFYWVVRGHGKTRGAAVTKLVRNSPSTTILSPLARPHSFASPRPLARTKRNDFPVGAPQVDSPPSHQSRILNYVTCRNYISELCRVKTRNAYGGSPSVQSVQSARPVLLLKTSRILNCAYYRNCISFSNCTYCSKYPEYFWWHFVRPVRPVRPSSPTF